MADASAITTRPWFLAFSLAPISPQARVLQVISWLVVLVLITVLLCLFPERKSVKSIMNDSGPFHRVIRQLAITRHILYDQTWSFPFLFTQHGRCLLGNLSSYFFVLLLSRPEYNEQRCWLVGGVDRWTNSPRRSVSPYHFYLESGLASLEHRGTTVQEKRDRHQCRSIYLPFLSWSLFF